MLRFTIISDLRRCDRASRVALGLRSNIHTKDINTCVAIYINIYIHYIDIRIRIRVYRHSYGPANSAVNRKRTLSVFHRSFSQRSKKKCTDEHNSTQFHNTACCAHRRLFPRVAHGYDLVCLHTYLSCKHGWASAVTTHFADPRRDIIVKTLATVHIARFRVGDFGQLRPISLFGGSRIFAIIYDMKQPPS